MFEELLKEMDVMTLGYTLMSLVDDTDLGSGPSLVSCTINKRSISKVFIEEFKAKAEECGLHDKAVDNAIIVGILPEWIEDISLEKIHGGSYTNHVKWTPKQPGDVPRNMLLYNRNHRRHYMQSHHPIKDTYLKYSNAAANLETAELSMKPSLEMVMKEGRYIIDKDRVWLVRFIDMGKSVQYNIRLGAHQHCIFQTGTLLSSNNLCLLQCWKRTLLLPITMIPMMIS
ncbi:hypothetical protein JVT61DRAFT_22 [Boletus reticuloceps]|uniref:Uncharacterized protein n=1 Tax=Boletus reticuloceps TaxID=495285 RepID=A0A8I3AFF0_9AGAM|nr:hypothetical protein JVT61DRAFT_22 [Boletus reticuloceps]